MRDRSTGEYIPNGVFQIVNLRLLPGSSDIDIAIVNSTVILKVARSIEHGRFRRNRRVRPRDKPVFRVLERRPRKVILPDVSLNSSSILRAIRIHEPKVDVLTCELRGDAC